MQQLLSKKVKSNVDIDTGSVRSRITGSLDSKNKSGRFTDMDTQALISITADTGYKNPLTGIEESPIIKELLSIRGDNLNDKALMSQDISLFGHASLSNIVERNENTYKPGQAVNTLDIYLTGAGLKTDLINEMGEMSRSGMKKQSERD